MEITFKGYIQHKNLEDRTTNTYRFDGRYPYPKETIFVIRRSSATDEIKVLPVRKNQ